MKSFFLTFQQTGLSRRAIYFAVLMILCAGTAFAQKTPQGLPGLPPGPMIDSNPGIIRLDRPSAAAPTNAAPPNDTAAASGRASAPSRSAQTRRGQSRLKVCGNPQVKCKTDLKFQPYDLPFQMPATTSIYETELFYAIILKSVKSPADECEIFVPESDRVEAQTLFPDRKVFTSRCYEPGEVGYTNTSATAHFMAVFGGITLAEANRTLARVKATGKFPGANIRRMRAMLNGT